MSTRAPSLGRGCRAQRGGVDFLWGRRSPLLFAFPIGERGPRQRRSGAFVNGALETIFPALFHTASPIQPPPLRGTSFHRKEGVSTRAPSLGRGCRAQRGGVGFLLGRRSGALVNGALEMHFLALFHTARTLSGSPPSPRGEGFVRRYSFSPRILYSL